MSFELSRRRLLVAGGAGLVAAGLDGVTRPAAAIPLEAAGAGGTFDLVV